MRATPSHDGPTGRETRLRCASAVHARLFDEELVILDLDKGEYFALDPVGARLWRGLEAGRTVEDIARDLVAEYDVSLEGLVADLLALANELVARGLMVRADAAEAGADRDG